MAPSAVDTSVVQALEHPFSEEHCHSQPSAKRRRISKDLDQGNATGQHDSQRIAPEISFVHPLGIKPAGNGLGAANDLRRSCGSFRVLPDEVLLQSLEYLEAVDLVRLGSSCKALYGFCSADEVWRTLFTESSPKSFSWRGTWRKTLLRCPASYKPIINCDGLFSDALYRPFFCSRVDLSIYAQSIPRRNQIARLDDLDEASFDSEWANKPFILTEPVNSWPVFSSWTVPALLDKYKDTVFRAEAVDWPLEEYVTYMNNSADESPLYLFDRAFAQKMGITVGRAPSDPPDAAYWPPQCFGEDLFAVLGDQRPDCRWMILGPERSGSTFHKDPNATSAWNAVLTGSKYWIMFPSSANIPPPPGVYVSEDQSEVTSPLSIAEWLLGFHAEARRTSGCKEGICGEGEVLHVPSGWFHLVLNLSPSLALTQNFIPRAHLVSALDFLKNKRDQVTGFSKEVEDPYGIFCARMRDAHPDLLQRALDELERTSEHKQTKWDRVTAAEHDDNAGGFSFGFGGDSEDDDVDA